MKLEVSEVFYSLQGEGVGIGRPSLFLRLSGCNLRCRYCDTKYAWGEGTVYPLYQLKEDLEKYTCRHLVVTGGEPLLQADGIKRLLEFMGPGWDFSLETNGTLWEEEVLKMFRLITLSPKLPSAGVGEISWEVLDRYISRLPSRIEAKFVVDDDKDWEALEEILERYDRLGVDIPLVIQPQGEVRSLELYLSKLRTCASRFLEMTLGWERLNLRFLPQFQKILWWDKRGV